MAGDTIEILLKKSGYYIRHLILVSAFEIEREIPLSPF